MKRIRQPLTLDYRLRIYTLFNEREQRNKTLFVLETNQSFSSFVYDISVKERAEGNTIHWKVLGLKPPRLSMPASGRARFEREYDSLTGMYDVTIESIDGRANTFAIRFAKEGAELVREPKEKFLEVTLEPSQHDSTL